MIFFKLPSYSVLEDILQIAATVWWDSAVPSSFSLLPKLRISLCSRNSELQVMDRLHPFTRSPQQYLRI